MSLPWNSAQNVNSQPAVLNAKQTGAAPSDYAFLYSLFSRVQEATSVVQQSITGTVAEDPKKLAVVQNHTFQQDTPLRMGKVLFAIPYLHCYVVQLAGRQGKCMAVASGHNAMTPLGVRSGEVIPPNSNVILWKPKSSFLAYIMGTVPSPLWSDFYSPAEILQQGGNTGIKQIPAYVNLINSSTDGLGVRAHTAGRPLDGTVGEYVRMSETGIGLLIDSFQAYLRVNEATGLFLNYFDDYAKLSGVSLDVQSYATHVSQRLDEGEIYSRIGHAIYPWEATGMYGPDANFTSSNDPAKVQLDRDFPLAEIDVNNPGQTPIHRLTEYGGYLGQGYQRMLMRPSKTSGIRVATDAASNVDTGLFHEMLSLDGSYGVRTAKSYSIVKYPAIPVPQELRKPEDAKGDDLAENNNYRFSGVYGSGDEHKVRDWDDSSVTDVPSILRAAGVMDMLSHQFNWKGTHAFAYHAKDYHYPQEKNGGSVLAAGVEFYRGSMSQAYVQVEPKKLEIDKRYGDSNYYNTMSFFRLEEDGSVIIADGFGSQLTMTGGQIRLEAGGDVMILSGSRAITMADDVILRARSNVDVSASDKDVRIKAENNIQVLAGNGGYGGILLETKGQGTSQNYQQKIGEEVQSAGITLLAKGSAVNAISQDNYIRTGVTKEVAEGYGTFIVDCGSGRGDCINYARQHVFVNSIGLGIYHSAPGQGEATINKSHFFGPSFSKINGPTVFTKNVVITENGALGVEGSVYSKGQIFALRAMACYKGRVGDSSQGETPTAIRDFIDAYEEAVPKFNTAGQTAIQYLQERVWAENRVGNNTFLLDEVGFSYRDNSQSGNAYGYAEGKFFLLETRWQQLDRMGLTQVSSSTWQENPVFYQGNSLYPWPGKKNWAGDETFLAYSNTDDFVVFDKGAKAAKDRDASQTDYESPVFKPWKQRVCDGNYKL
jgi:hypothetical protein